MLHRKRLILLLALILAILVAAPFVRTAGFAFVDYDDPQYIFENPTVTAGLTWEGIVWAFTTFDEANWHPLTWLSHMLDVTLFGTAAGAHHLTNVVIHLVGTVTLFLVFTGMTGNAWGSFLTAALFGVHPLHVESVAWVAERKDVLAGLFWMLALGAYLRYSRRPGKARYSLVLMAFALGLLAKPMLVTLPFVLLLLDWWPLGRWELRRKRSVGAGERTEGSTVSNDIQRQGAVPIIMEKVPLLVMSAASSAVTLAAQAQVGAVSMMEWIHTWTRLSNALLSYTGYLAKMFWPTGLAFYYPLAGPSFLSWKVVAAAALLCLATAIFILAASRLPWLIVGWFWYLGTLVPVIGFVQVGGQSMADRYTYLPLIGVFAACVWSAVAAVEKMPRLARAAAAVAAVTVLVLLQVATSRQVGYWKDSRALFTRALAVTEGNWMAHKSYGRLLAQEGDYKQAIEHYRKALDNFSDPIVLSNLSDALDRMGDPAAAIATYREAVIRYQELLAIAPGNDNARNNLAVALVRLGRTDEALSQYREAIHLNPRNAEAFNNIGIAHASKGERAAAIVAYQEALRINPRLVEVRYNLANSLNLQGRREEAVVQYREVLAIVPGHSEAHNNLAVTLVRLGRSDEAIAHYREAIRLNPRNAEAYNNLGSALNDRGRVPEARAQYLEALKIRPDYVSAMGNLAEACMDEGQLEEAVAWYRRILQGEPDNTKARERIREILSMTGKGNGN